MITKQQALTAKNFEHVSFRNNDGTPLRARRNGKTQVWKTRPTEFRIPCKHGLNDCFDITHLNADHWNVELTD
jgi:hypothetical protein